MAQNLFAGRVEDVGLEEEIQRSYLDYAMSVIVGRALPDVRDGLKPVHRRILWSMIEQGLRPDRPYRKSANVVGGVMSKYHPHGDAPIYDALVRMAQDFSLRHPLVDPHGNFGSIDGDPPAAARYTEARLAPIALELLRDIESETVDFVPNYDGYEQEPLVLPSRFPNLLVNGAGGIAVGMATNIPPHNLGEVIDGVIHSIDNPECTPQDLMKFIKGPDFPTGAAILGRQGIVDAYTTGRGSIKVRGITSIEETANGRQRIVVTELPYQVNKARLAEKIADLVRTGKIKDIADLSDHSSGRAGMRLVIDLKRNANPHVVLNQLYKHTQLQDNFGVIMLALVDNVPRTLDLAEMIGYYVDHQVDVETRRTRFELRKREERDHIVLGLLIALDHLDEVIRIIRGSQDADEARTKLMTKFKLSEIQANHILDMPLRRLTRLARAELEAEHKELVARIKYLKELLKDPAKIRAVIKEDLLEVRKRLANPRRTSLKAEEGEMGIEDLIAEEDVVISVSRAGYVKRQPIEAFRRQGRGGKGVRGQNLKEEDVVSALFTTTTHHWLLFFTNRGKVYRVKVHEIPEAGRTARGLYAANLPGVAISGEERISAVFDLKEYSEGRYLFFATRRGIVKKTPLPEYDSPRTGLAAINIRGGDELFDVLLTDGKDDIFLVSRKGQAIRFSEAAARPMGRATGGVIGMRLAEDDEVIAVGAASRGEEMISVTEQGYGKRTPLKDYPRKGRGGKGVVGHKLTTKTGRLAGAFVGSKEQDVFVISSSGIVIRVPAEQIRRVGRASQGVRTMRVDEGHHVVALAPVIKQMDEPDKIEAASGGTASIIETGAAAAEPELGPERSPALRGTSPSTKKPAVKKGAARKSSTKKTAAKKKTTAAKTKTAARTKKTAARTTAAKKPSAKKTVAKKKAVTKKAAASKRTSARGGAARGGTSRTAGRRRRS
ncbi:MAG: DNA gyrase subunit A [Actinomycetota bacterium]|nr:DNA gyrase subunit A [Actinomycetota bacterium]